MTRVFLPTFSLVALISGVICADEPKGPDYSDREDLANSDFRKQKLQNANFERSVVNYTLFSEADLTGASFRKSDCRGCSFYATKLAGANFTKANLSASGFGQGADMSKAVLDDAIMKMVSLQGAKLHGASLKNTSGVSDVTKADFTDADLRNCDLSQAKDYGPLSAIYKGAKYDGQTRFPAGVDPEKVGAIRVKDDATAAAQPAPAQLPFIRMGNAKLYYVGITKPDAVKLADYLEEKHGYGKKLDSIQVRKVGKVYCVSFDYVAIPEGELEVSDAYKNLAKDLAASLYSGSEVEVHLCQKNFKSDVLVKPDGSVLDLRDVAKTEPKPEPKPAANANPKPTTKPEPKTPATATEFGTELKFEKAQIFYTKAVSKEDAAKLGDYLVKELGFGEKPMKLQLTKEGGAIQIRMAVAKGMQDDPDFLRDCKELGQTVGKNVFPKSPVEVHLCDDALKTLRVVKP